MSIITLAFLCVVLYVARDEIVQAYHLIDSANLWILSLLIPLQLLSYYASAEVFFSYLKKQGHIKPMSAFMLPRLSIEMNFVNHVLPSGGLSGISYMGWRLKHFGVSASKSTAAQVVRMVATFGSFAALLVLAVFVMAFDGNISRWVVASAVALVLIMGGAVVLVAFLLGKKKRATAFARGLSHVVNSVVSAVTFGRKRHMLQIKDISHFFDELQDEYIFIRKNKRVLIVPLLWGVLFNAAEVAMFYVTFLALGHPVNPAPLVIAYGLAGTAGFFMVTPGGAGAYEAIMVMFLAIAGINPGFALLAILLTRVLLMLGTIALGYLFYQQAILQHGKSPRIQRK